ncbi:hypothetical protein GCM10027445_21690 [Amycolatopsis endophytica]|uniref:Uncharacterized protein n=1 Tax=Amycolatopsis endophytica TaxID=860233 RepID=A0A853BDI3_9PSEU|nr:hypothetical protein [Amycolatopsis endophytica]NYI93433.1 hypothetical protein [Amycolatopsis endophytica]
MLFGIYPGSVTGDDSGGLAGGPADDPELMADAVGVLQGRPDRPFLVRAYLGFHDETPPVGPHPTLTPVDAARYTGQGRSLDLVAQYQSASGNIAGYQTFLRQLVEQYGPHTGTLQVTEEPNVPGNPTLDGYYPKVVEALVTGVGAAKDHARRLGHDHLRVGFNTTPLFGPGASFIAGLTEAGGPEFVRALDYVGLDFFPDVFRPVPAAELGDAVTGLLRHHRDNILTPAGLGHLPVHITEHGWPTGPGRSPQRQSEVVETVVRTIATHAAELGISGYTHFALRDADSENPGLFHRFGLMTDGYTPKPSFHTYRDLIDELGH